MTEEPLLGFFWVLVHGISDHDEVDGSARDHLLDIFFLEVVTQNDGQDSWSELQDLSGVQWGSNLLSLVLGSLREVEKTFAEVVSLLEQSLLSEVVFDIFKVGVRDWRLGWLVVEGQEELFEGILDFVTKR